MKANIHPQLHDLIVKCACQQQYKLKSVSEKSEIATEVCRSCHRFFSGEQTVVATGRVDAFRRRFAKFNDTPPTA